MFYAIFIWAVVGFLNTKDWLKLSVLALTIIVCYSEVIFSGVSLEESFNVFLERNLPYFMITSITSFFVFLGIRKAMNYDSKFIRKGKKTREGLHAWIVLYVLFEIILAGLTLWLLILLKISLIYGFLIMLFFGIIVFWHGLTLIDYKRKKVIFSALGISVLIIAISIFINKLLI